MKPIKKLNLTRRRAELALLDTVNRINSLGASMTATLNRSEPKTRFATGYKVMINKAKEQLEQIEDYLDETEQMLEQQGKEKKRLEDEKVIQLRQEEEEKGR